MDKRIKCVLFTDGPPFAFGTTRMAVISLNLRRIAIYEPELIKMAHLQTRSHFEQKVNDGLYGKVQPKAELNRITAILFSYQIDILFVSG